MYTKYAEFTDHIPTLGAKSHSYEPVTMYGCLDTLHQYP